MKMISKWKDPISALTHLIGLILIIPCIIMLIYMAYEFDTIWHVVSFSVFGASLILLYSASTIYHMLNVSEKNQRILKRIDHMMIFILIAGTYTPVCLVSLRGVWGWTLFSLVWGIAVIGIILKIFWIDAPRWLSTSIYVIMGWLVLFAFYPLIKTVPISGVITLLLGGISYTVGAVIYGTKRPKINFKMFGFHEIFHLFVMGGSFFHILFMFKYIL